MSRLSINVAKHPNGTPLFGKGGVAAPIKEKRRSLLSGRRRGGSFQPPIYRKLNEPPRPRFSKERGHLLDGAATPPLPRRGVPCGCFATFQVHCVFTNPTVLPAEVRRSEVRQVVISLELTIGVECSADPVCHPMLRPRN